MKKENEKSDSEKMIAALYGIEDALLGTNRLLTELNKILLLSLPVSVETDEIQKKIARINRFPSGR